MLVSNPLANPLFLPLIGILGGVLALSLLYTLIVERKHLSELHKRSLFHRWGSSAIISLLVLPAIFAGTGPLCVLITLMAVIGTIEYGLVTRLTPAYFPIAILFSIAIPIATASTMQPAAQILLDAFLMTGATAVFTYGRLTRHVQHTAVTPEKIGTLINTTPSQPTTTVAAEPIDSHTLSQASLCFLAVIYTPFLGSYAILIGTLEHGSGLLLSLIASIALCDTLAFVCGKAVGHLTPKLAPHVSPNKTWAGAIGSVIGSYVGFLILPLTYPAVCPALPTEALLILPPMIAVAGTIGDLFESVIKRSYGVKDAGSWLPGFGGLLDRIDSLLFALPVCYYIVLSFIS